MFATRVVKSRLLLAPMRSLYRNKTPESKALITNMAIHDHVLERFDTIIKSENDDRFYRGLVLANKMKVLLISDPGTDKSAAALDVNIGSMCDPDDLPGLAHFCEHMLFLGTEKYPEQNDYSKYLSENSGVSNATTYLDHTTYYFDVSPTKLEGALDRFAQFFLTPLFTDTLTELELNAIHSEHLKNLACDIWRFDQLEKSTANPRHPYSKFGTGNRETLDVLPKQMGINVRERLLEFHEKYYSANIMSLCVLGKESLDELEQMVVNLFSQVRNKEIDVPVWREHPFNDEHFRTKWHIVPIKDRRNLHVTFPIPDLHQHYQAAPSYYVSHLLGHEGEGSLLSALKTRGWCNSLICGKHAYARGFCFFILVVDLTEEGFKHTDDIITLMFQYINMLKKQGPIEWIYNEYRDLANVNFRFTEKQQPRLYASSRVSGLWDYPMNEVLCADRLFPQWKPDLIDTIVKCLTPQNIRVHVVAKACEGTANETEHWYGTKYKKEKISAEVIDMWENAGYNSELHLPARNEFIPSRLDIKPRDENVKEFPAIIEDTSFVRLWYKRDDEFSVPKAKMFFDFVSPFAYMDPVSCNLGYMFVQLLQDSFTEYVYPADLAGLHWKLSYTQYGITLSIFGYDDKQHLLLEKIVDRMLNLKINPERFEILKEDYIRDLKNFAAEQPYHHAIYYLALLLAEQAWTKNELLDATAYLTVGRIQAFIPQLFSRVHVECLIHGNMTEKEALDMVRLIESKLKSAMPHITPLWQQQLVVHREIRLDDGRHFLFQTENKLHKSSCTEVYYQIGMQSTELNMLLQLLAQIIGEPCFNVLRTQEQLGYIVFSGAHKVNVMQGLKIIVQSDKQPRYVEKRIDLFIDSMFDYISTMSEEKFERHKNSLATLRLEKPKKLFYRTNILWSEISAQKYNFDRVNIEVAYLKTITREQLLNFFKENIHGKARRKLSLHVISTATDDDESAKEELVAEEELEKINDIFAFKRSQSLYPMLEPYIHQFPKKGIYSSKL
ncbi:PREDICTED: insulin-degrading enzyme isoform X1 [Dinoponera quadriceps]|uniref:Insulin-degrading enzyme n=1 Tax=Dinoponera quadriceps TaxID=609295 RepID=A0A6P3WXW5_DINQU|nr:PREDICTED: insulin-degrading enzyme isoform X1 [Dinoponera quadriceps]